MRLAILPVLTTALLLVSAHAAIADDVPSPFNGSIPSFIRLVGADAFGRPDTAGRFTVVHRDLANNPIPGAHVFVEFAAAPELQLCPVQATGVAFVPGGVEGITGQDGSVTMTLLGYAIPNIPPPSQQAVRIYADGVLLGTIRASAFDLDGASGVAGSDLSRWLADFVTATDPPRADYDGSGTLSGADFSQLLRVFVRGGSVQSCPSVVISPE